MKSESARALLASCISAFNSSIGRMIEKREDKVVNSDRAMIRFLKGLESQA